MILHLQIRTGSDWWFSKILRIRTGSDSILSDQDWTRTEKFDSPLISGSYTKVKHYTGSLDRDYYIGSQTKTLKLPHPTGNSTLVLLTGKATLLPTLFFALHKQDSASGSFKLQFALNLHSVSVVHFASIGANWRISSFSRGFGLLGFCLPRIWIHVLRRSL